MQLSNREVLILAKALISDPAKWTQGAPARDKNGVVCPSYDRKASCFCAAGAITRTMREDYSTFYHGDAVDAFQAVVSAVSGVGITEFNDESSHSEVMNMFDIAIERMKK